MSASYRLFGAETSAYSSKLRSYLRYKGVDHEWTPRTAASEADLSAAARFKTLPVLVTSSGHAVHDTTPMMEALEADQPEPSAVPETQAAAMIAAVLEDYADLWLSKAVMQYRWGRRKDQKEAAARAVAEYYGDDMPDDRKAQEKTAIERMTAEMPRIGLTPDVGGVVEKSFKRFVKLLNAHLERHLYLFGGRPCLADFALAGQLSQMLKDPTPAKIIEKDGPFVKAWCEFMDDPKPGGPFEPLEECLDTLTSIFKKEVCITFLPWAAANLEAAYAKNAMVEVSLGKDAVFHAPLRSSA
ncbi:MAG: glutathione S-transferase family protein, partial [Pseudomonadota bacterium]